MTIEGQTKLLLKALEPWAADNGGNIKVASDKVHLFQILGASPGAPRAAVYFAGEKSRSKHFKDIAGKVDRKFWVCISRGRGFSAELGKSLTEGVAGGKPMFVLLEQAREEVRAVRLSDQEDDDSRAVYRGTYPIEFEVATVDAYYLEILLAADIPEQK
jgi:hypothetical protein